MTGSLHIAVLCDVHGNLPALQSVLDDIDRYGRFDHVVAAGDYCLNGPEPAECLDLVLGWADVLLKGNTDRDLVDEGASDPDLGEKKRAAIAWTREQLGERRIGLLDGLDFDHRVEAPDGTSILIVHANPLDLDTHISPDMTEDEVNQIVGGVDASLLVFGHLHIPYERVVGPLRLFDVSSVGLPRDGDRRAAWGEFSWSPDSGWEGRIHRVGYDYGETVLRILDSGMPHRERRIRDLLRASYD
ncbi:MAG: metallophosphatase family protein [Chloroflexota bacterium]|nr:metallophosphatase family protein [Chloroflexota bacterium]